jgi:hypothetical protein
MAGGRGKFQPEKGIFRPKQRFGRKIASFAMTLVKYDLWFFKKIASLRSQ